MLVLWRQGIRWRTSLWTVNSNAVSSDAAFATAFLLLGREAREFSALVAQDCVLPLPFHLLFLSYSHIVVLLYASGTCLPQGEWGAWGNLHVYLIHLILEYAESGSTATLYLHGLCHAFAQPHLPIQLSDDAGECDLRLGKTFATLTTTCPEHSIRATLSHELYMKFTDRKLRRSQDRLWKLVRRGVVLEQCVLSASPKWRVIAQRIIRPLMAQSSIRVLCHPVTHSILLQLDPSVLEHDIYCICGRCGTKHSGVCRWIAFSIEILQGWPTFSYVAVGAFLPCCQGTRQGRGQGTQTGAKQREGCCCAPLVWRGNCT